MIEFEAFIKPQAQGSSNAYIRGGRAIVTSANKNLKPYRAEVRDAALAAFVCCPTDELRAKWHAKEQVFSKHVPVTMTLTFTFLRPPSVKKRVHPVVPFDLDKLIRATGDALTGVIYHDDAQVVEIIARKQYGAVEGVHVRCEEIK